MKHDIYPLPPSAVDNSYAIITDIIDIIGVQSLNIPLGLSFTKASIITPVSNPTTKPIIIIITS